MSRFGDARDGAQTGRYLASRWPDITLSSDELRDSLDGEEYAWSRGIDPCGVTQHRAITWRTAALQAYYRAVAGRKRGA
jgi:hypothetical protein